MAKAEATLQNFANSELSPKMRGRWNLPVFQNGCEVLQNFISEIQGASRFRTGFRYVVHTRRNKVPWFIKFQFSNQQSYVLEFTDFFMRVYKDDGIVLESTKTITGITKANPAVVTSNGHGYANGDEVYISGVVGMTEVNGKFFIVANKAANTFELTDQDGNNVNSTNYTTYASAGTAAKVFELATPYDEDDDLSLLRVAQNADTMYVVHPYYEQRKLTRSSHTSWSLVTFTRTNDFITKKTITGASQANPCNILCVGHGFATGDIVVIETVVGMTELNSKYYTITKVDADNFTLDGIDSTGFTAYGSAGYAFLRNQLPGATTFYESALWYAKFANSPLAIKKSRAPDNNGTPRYDDFTNGTNADDAIETVVDSEDESAIQWIRGLDKFLGIGAFNGVYKVTGDTDDEAISPTSLKIRKVSSVGTSIVNPISIENGLVFVEQHNLTVRSFEFDVIQDTYVAKDTNLISDHITNGLIKQMTFQKSRPDVAWMIKEDGRLIGMTYKATEDVNGYHRHQTRVGDTFLTLLSIPRSENFDRLWVCVQRVIDGHTRRYVEYLEDPAEIPEFIDYFTSTDNYDTDNNTFLRAMFEAQKSVYHLDSMVTYDGSDTSIASTTMTPGAASGTLITFTAGAAIFKSTDVGREIWLKPVNGVGTGRAVIVEYTNSTHVKCNIKETFSSISAMAAGSWFFTTDSLTNLDHLEGESVQVIADGNVHPAETVTSGAITLDYQASIIHVGLKYIGILKTMNLEVGGVGGSSQTKEKNVNEVGIRFLNSLGAKYGTNLYKNMQQIKVRSAQHFLDRPAPLFSGDLKIPVQDTWEKEKHVIILQENGLPCNVQLIQAYTQTSNK